MATITVTGQNRKFPVGTSVGLYPASALPAGSGVDRAPAGSAIVSATVDAAGVLTFSDPLVVADTPYVAYANVGGAPTAIQVASSSRPASSAALGTGDTTSGSAVVANVAATQGAFVVGQRIVGAGIPGGTYVLSVSGATVTMSAAATATGTGVALEGHGGTRWRAKVMQRRAAIGTS
jgi:hypothetical protein